jgi:hypothetical protein
MKLWPQQHIERQQTAISLRKTLQATGRGVEAHVRGTFRCWKQRALKRCLVSLRGSLFMYLYLDDPKLLKTERRQVRANPFHREQDAGASAHI